MSDGEEAGGGQVAVAFPGGGSRKEVASYLLLQEEVVGNVVVEGPDDVVPVSPGMREGRIASQPIVAIRFAVTPNIQPMPAPAFTEMRRGQESIDQSLHCRLPVLLAGVEERADLVVGRSQSDEVEVESTDQRSGWGIIGGPEFPGLQLGKEEPVDVIPGPVLVACPRGGWFVDRLEGPEGGTIGLCVPRALFTR